MSTNIKWDEALISREERWTHLDCRGATLWFTGLSGSGKSTVAAALEKRLLERGVRAYRLDGDNIRHGLNRNLGFSAQDRKENIRRIGEVSRLFADAGVLTLSSFVSPYRSDRDCVRALLDDGDFLEVFVNTPLEVCEQRDRKGLYAKARAGIIKEFTGISDPYEEPADADITIDTTSLTPEEAAQQIILHLEREGYIGLGEN